VLLEANRRSIIYWQRRRWRAQLVAERSDTRNDR
jgi:hypothetical protein